MTVDQQGALSQSSNSDQYEMLQILFGDHVPKEKVWEDPQEILDVLSTIIKRPHKYMLFTSYGTKVLLTQSVEAVGGNRELLKFNGDPSLLAYPVKLIFQGFEDDPGFNNFRLICDERKMKDLLQTMGIGKADEAAEAVRTYYRINNIADVPTPVAYYRDILNDHYLLKGSLRFFAWKSLMERMWMYPFYIKNHFENDDVITLLKQGYEQVEEQRKALQEKSGHYPD